MNDPPPALGEERLKRGLIGTIMGPVCGRRRVTFRPEPYRIRIHVRCDADR